MHSPIYFEIRDLRAQNTQKVLEAILVVLAALFVIALLPSLLYTYVYAQAQLLEQPLLLELLPVVTFALAVLYVIYVVVGNIRRTNQIKALKLQVAEYVNFGKDTADEMITQKELDELENIVEQAISEVEGAEAKTGRRKASRKSAARKTSARRTTKPAAKRRATKKSK